MFHFDNSVLVFPSMAKLLPTLMKTNNTHNFSIRSNEGLTLETSAFQIVYSFDQLHVYRNVEKQSINEKIYFDDDESSILAKTRVFPKRIKLRTI